PVVPCENSNSSRLGERPTVLLLSTPGRTPSRYPRQFRDPPDDQPQTPVLRTPCIPFRVEGGPPQGSATKKCFARTQASEPASRRRKDSDRESERAPTARTLAGPAAAKWRRLGRQAAELLSAARSSSPRLREPQSRKATVLPYRPAGSRDYSATGDPADRIQSAESNSVQRCVRPPSAKSESQPADRVL